MRKQAQITAISAWKVETCDVDCEKSLHRQVQ
jgi:hypothetical protein